MTTASMIILCLTVAMVVACDATVVSMCEHPDTQLDAVRAPKDWWSGHHR